MDRTHQRVGLAAAIILFERTDGVDEHPTRLRACDVGHRQLRHDDEWPLSCGDEPAQAIELTDDEAPIRARAVVAVQSIDDGLEADWRAVRPADYGYRSWVPEATR